MLELFVSRVFKHSLVMTRSLVRMLYKPHKWKIQVYIYTHSWEVEAFWLHLHSAVFIETVFMLIYNVGGKKP